MKSWMLFASVLCVSAGLCSGCGAFDFDIERPISEVKIEGDPELAAQFASTARDVIPPQMWETDLPGIPAGIFLEAMELRITDTENQNGEDDFSFLDEVVFYLEPVKPDSSLRRRPFAWGVNPGAEQTMQLVPNRALNLVPYILEGFQATSDVRARVPASDVTLDGTATLSVDLL